MEDAVSLQTFRRRVFEEFLAGYCEATRYPAEGFREVTLDRVQPEDARDFLRALDSGVVAWDGGQALRARRSRASECIFWELERTTVPRAFTTWLEPIITIAAVARLHLDYGWPENLLGMQTEGDWAFDAASYLTTDAAAEHIACEVKKTSRELDKLITLMKRFGEGETPNLGRSEEKNASRKVDALRARRAPYFWAVGPGGQSYVFKTEFPSAGLVSFQPVPLEGLHFRQQ